MVSSISRMARRTWRSIRKRTSRAAAIRYRMGGVAEEDLQTLQAVDGLTMVSLERLYAFIDAVRHVVRHNVPGAIVECGVWRGGATIAAIRTLQNLGETGRDVCLYDTFEGMNEPTEYDLDFRGQPAMLEFNRLRTGRDRADWCRADLESVRRAVLATGYPKERIHFVQGKVEDTLPQHAPRQVAVLRLDTDWYESTRHELAQLYPRMPSGGVLLIDDYGYWQGARRAVDEYLAENRIPLFLTRCDYTGRMGVKP
jgi:hypothetical protein